MEDQATDLRQLVRRGASLGTTPRRESARRIVVTGGKGGVGTTSVAVNLAVAIAKLPARVTLIDADLDRGNVASLCGKDLNASHQSSDSRNFADILTGRLTAEQVMRTGPEGIRLVPGVWGFDHTCQCTAAAQDRLLDQLDQVARKTDYIVLDAGNGIHPLTRRYWTLADTILLVTTPELNSVMDAYASLKMFAPRDGLTKIHPLLNRATTPEATQDVQQRLGRASLRFLGIHLESVEDLASDPRVASALRLGEPVVQSHPRSTYARQIGRLAARLASKRPEPQDNVNEHQAAGSRNQNKLPLVS